MYENFRTAIIWLSQVALIITAFQVYLQINKIWKRKHEREVAKSQSIAGMFLLAMGSALSVAYYAVNDDKPDWISIIDTSFYLFQAFIFGMIATGVFVKGEDRRSIWKLILKSLRLERKEAKYLLNKFLKPSNANVIINMLHQLAMIDDNLDPKEEELINAFAKEWNIEYNPEKLNFERLATPEQNFMRLRNSVEAYVKSEPPKEQASQLREMMNALINADDEVSPEEDLIASELIGIITSYITSDGAEELKTFDVLIVPQNDKHHEFIKQLAPEAEQFEISGGFAYSIGSYYSQKYAEMICNQYREVNLFTIVHNPPKND
jgi:hypothetical protein